MLGIVDTICLTCRQQTDERILASALIRTLPENQVFGGRLRIVECQRCGLRYLNPMPSAEALPKIYSFDVYADSTNTNEVLRQYFRALLVRHCKTMQRVLEIGCGTGEFLALLEEDGADVVGVEFAESAHRVKFRGQLYVGRMEEIEIPHASFDAVLLLNVIEHLGDPPSVLRKIRALLRPEGTLLLRHPNSDLFFNRIYQCIVEWPKFALHRWLVWRRKKTRFTIVGFQNQHLFYLNRASVARMLADADFEIREFSTVDPYNRERIGRCLRSGKIVEAGVACVRHVLGHIGLGPECLIVAGPKRPEAEARRGAT